MFFPCCAIPALNYLNYCFNSQLLSHLSVVYPFVNADFHVFPSTLCKVYKGRRNQDLMQPLYLLFCHQNHSGLFSSASSSSPTPQKNRSLWHLKLFCIHSPSFRRSSAMDLEKIFLCT